MLIYLFDCILIIIIIIIIQYLYSAIMSYADTEALTLHSENRTLSTATFNKIPPYAHPASAYND